jgi:uncharacterized SAM-binding protein YcdF (DUF218 family)
VLGAAVLAPGLPGAALIRRTEHGINVLFASNARYLLLSGGSLGDAPAEAMLMAEIARHRGVARERIVLEQASRNTFENAVYSGAIIRREGWRRVIVVTDGYHLPRALYCFRRLGLSVEGAAVPRQPATSRLAWYRQHAEEVVRLARCAGLFLIGSHKPIISRIWHP